MGTLKPGATYIYERVGDAVYARESGAGPNTRQKIGYTSDMRAMTISSGGGLGIGTSMPTMSNWTMTWGEWGEIQKLANTNPAVKIALEKLMTVYYLSKEDGNSKT